MDTRAFFAALDRAFEGLLPEDDPFEVGEQVLTAWRLGAGPALTGAAQGQAPAPPSEALPYVRQWLARRAVACRAGGPCPHHAGPCDRLPACEPTLLEALGRIHGFNRALVAAELLRAFQTCVCTAAQVSLLELAGAAALDTLVEPCAEGLEARSPCVREAYAAYLERLGGPASRSPLDARTPPLGAWPAPEFGGARLG